MKNVLRSLFAVLCVTGCLFLFARSINSQTEKLGIVQYSAVPGWAKTSKVENVIAYNTIDAATGKFGIITLYGATPGTGNPQSDFAREWNNLVVKNMKVDANPKTDMQAAEGWTVTSGGSEADSADVGKAVAFLTVISGFQTTVSILAVFNDPAYGKKVDDFIGALDIDKPPVAATPAESNTASDSATFDDAGHLIVPLITRQLSVADLAGEWGESDTRLSTAYFSSNTGNYVGTDRLAFKTKHAVTKNGGYSNDFFAIRNGQKIIDKTHGTIWIDGRVITIIQLNNETKRNSTSSYVVYGFLDLRDMTVMKISVNFWGREIPEQVFSNYDPKYTNATTWIRKKK